MVTLRSVQRVPSDTLQWVGRPCKVLQSTKLPKVAFKGILLTSQSRMTIEDEGGKEGDAPSLALPVIGPIGTVPIHVMHDHT
jgi:hypothetical protein